MRLGDNARSRLSLAPESLAEELSSAVANTAGREGYTLRPDGCKSNAG